RDLLQEAHRPLLVLPRLDLLPALVVVDPLERKVDLRLRRVDAQNARDDLLTLADVVTDVLDPPRGHLGEMDERLPLRVLVQGDEGAEVPDRGHRTDDEFAFLGKLRAQRHPMSASPARPSPGERARPGAWPGRPSASRGSRRRRSSTRQWPVG